MGDIDMEAGRATPRAQVSGTDYIYPSGSNPYDIVAPAYMRNSAGVRVLHLLCHALNRRGQTARMIIYGEAPAGGDIVSPDLMTPLLTPGLRALDFRRGLTPITVYPEVISGNPFSGSCVVRYVLNFPGLLAGDAQFPPEDLCFSFSAVLAAHTPHPDNVLFMPVIDTRVFRPPPVDGPRQGTCFYAFKYKDLNGGALMDVTRESVEITNHRQDSQSPEEIAALFHRCELFYAYENTSLATEAVLCGCPAVLLPNPYFTESIALKELGTAGYAWGTDPAEIARAKATVHEGARIYLAKYQTFWRDLDLFIDRTQAHAAARAFGPGGASTVRPHGPAD